MERGTRVGDEAATLNHCESGYKPGIDRFRLKRQYKTVHPIPTALLCLLDYIRVITIQLKTTNQLSKRQSLDQQQKSAWSPTVSGQGI